MSYTFVLSCLSLIQVMLTESSVIKLSPKTRSFISHFSVFLSFGLFNLFFFSFSFRFDCFCPLLPPFYSRVTSSSSLCQHVALLNGVLTQSLFLFLFASVSVSGFASSFSSPFMFLFAVLPLFLA